MSRWRCSSLSICVHVFVCVMKWMYTVTLLSSSSALSVSPLSYFLVMFLCLLLCKCCNHFFFFSEISESEVNITGSNFSTSPSHTLPPLSPPTRPSPALVRGTWLVIPVSSLLHWEDRNIPPIPLPSLPLHRHAHTHHRQTSLSCPS